MVLDGAVFPDAVRGLWSLLNGVELLDTTLLPTVHRGADFFQPLDGKTWVHIQRSQVTTGEIDRVEEVRLDVYGPSVLESTDLSEAILTFICGDYVDTPASDIADAFFFDDIEHQSGPTPLEYPNTEVIPCTTTVAVRARPTN